MAGGNVHDVESLEAFHAALLRLGSQWDKALQEVRMTVQRAETYFAEDRPRYWRQQWRRAEQELNEARDDLATKRSAVRPGDRPPATEAARRVQRAELRLRECESKQRAARQWAIEMARSCDDVLGPLADAIDQCQTQLPAAAYELRGLIDRLHRYMDLPGPGGDSEPDPDA